MSKTLLIALVFATSCFGQDFKDLAPDGVLRVAFIGSNPTQGKVDAQSGAVSGMAVDLARELGRQLGIPVAITPLANARAVLESVKSNAADLGFLAFDATRATEVDFSQVYALGWSTYAVATGSAIKSVADVDRAGVRAAANAGDSPDLFLTRALKQATLKHVANTDTGEALRLLTAGEIDAYATNRQRLVELAATTPGIRVLPDNFFAVEQAMIVPKGSAAGLALVNRFLNEMRGTGFIKQAIDRAKLIGFDVAPAAK